MCADPQVLVRGSARVQARVLGFVNALVSRLGTQVRRDGALRAVMKLPHARQSRESRLGTTRC